MVEKALTAAVAGASGYAGGEIVRLLQQHPRLNAVILTAHSNAGEKVAGHFPHLDLDPEMTFVDTTVENLIGHDVVILGLPHGQSGPIASQVREQSPDTLVVDLGADFRLADPAAWEEFYGSHHAGTWTYGMPELLRATGTGQRDLLGETREIAVPGCNASAVTFALMPLVARGLIDPTTLGAVLAVGYSGAGRSPKPHLLLSEAAAGAVPYSAGGQHRHIPEIIQNLAAASGEEADGFRLTFTPVLVPMSRGIQAVVTAKLADSQTPSAAITRAFHDAYADEPFIRLLGEGAFPNTASAAGANSVLLGWDVDEKSGTVTVMAALDNLVKGTAGAAIQSINLALGLPEGTGLSGDGLRP
ncbi:N-acetyl-gamma-glutamyl-phosphate reductase [Helcobacillus massiliensis]|uniref:N-acetyl-gamma-glutamyl-phosphate reductase n=1 Tax=Helcobacillus massiliensis TaxID=521392 RepID=UPI002552952B|nr:N-acetyl-gamma-glutamyl-phosphate reductase [Helcobacillus massiliensis]MDK7743139.1 N-acetyl-gamma-glutamyl-phosphate reductase [Helcobacillus massiliensis]WOO93419.1 N-acetyl-gamma-glutamyl-phosphate reductase [Helcobacillus massiliensis]